MKQNVIVVDDFYEDPDSVRTFALSQDFYVKGNFPGDRTKSFSTEKMKHTFEKLIGNTISYWPRSEADYNGCFQLTTSRMRSWIHRDITDWAAVIYLTPNAPFSGGTGFYKHKNTGNICASNFDEENKQMDMDSYDNSKWELIDNIGNVYNRLILFRGKRSHSSMVYFGNTKNDGRLFQTFFFNDGLPNSSGKSIEQHI